MRITWDEIPGSFYTTSNPKTDTVSYCLTGVSTIALARAYAAGASPVIRGDLWRSNISCDEIGFQLWRIDVTWGPYCQKEHTAGDVEWSFDTTGGTKHITHALEHINTSGAKYGYVPTGKEPVNHGGAIGVNESGDVEGVDVPDKRFKWTESRRLLLASFNWTYAGILDDLTGCTNSAAFRGYPIGTVLFAGASGQTSSKDPLYSDITYHFEYQRSGANLTVGEITGIAKVGWQYVWVEYGTKDGGAANRLGKKARQVNVERVLESGDFTLLGIGTEAL